MKGKIGDMMRQAQQMQETLRTVQGELAAMEVTGQSGGGLVSVVMTGKHEVRRVEIAPELLDEEREMIEDLVAAATNDAVARVAAVTEEKMGSVTSGLPLPPGLRPF